MKTAKFTYINGVGALLCSKCSKVIKTGDQFSTMEKHAFDGMVTMLPRYCDKHIHLDMDNLEREKEALRKGIKEKLRENIMKKNILGVFITRPNQELIVMRGVSGSGKSTKAKFLVGEGKIHSTDELIEATGDYRGFFKLMIESKNFSNLGKMHHQNFLNVRKSILEGITPIILDNTNLKANEPKQVVVEALKLGYDENNIKIVDVGTGGLTADVLAERNTHGLTIEKIEKMMSSHKGVGPLSVKKIVESKDMHDNNSDKVLYAAVVLDDSSQKNLIKVFSSKLPDGWKIFAHHMTIIFGKGLDDKSEIGKEVELTVTELGISDMAMAVKVEGYPSTNDIPHITIAVNTAEGGKPFLSNKITNWGKIDLGRPLKLYGIVTEIKG